jgi:hypothetical protein
MIHDSQFPILKKINNSNLENYYKHKIVQLFYLLSRKHNDYDILNIENLLEELLRSLKNNMNSLFQPYLVILYKMIAQTRDVINGKGEHKLTYMMIYVWYKFYPTLAIYAIHQLVDLLILPEHSNNDIHVDELISSYVSSRRICFGSWKDIKYLCYFLVSRSQNHPLIDVCISIMNKQLFRDWNIFSLSCDNTGREEGIIRDYRNILSFVAKWIPRENTKFEWLFEKLAVHWAQMVTPYLFKNKLLSYSQNDALLKKCKMNYRIVFSTLNKLLDTMEIKQCMRKWDHIVPANIPKLAMNRQKNALLNVNKHMESRIKTTYNKDRRNCAHTIKEYYKDLIQPDNNLFRHNFELGHFVKQYSLLRCIDSNDLEVIQNRLYQMDMLNKNWDSFIKRFHSLQKCIPFVDIYSSSPAELYSAIELASIIATKTSLEDARIMFSNHIPVWMKFDNEKVFYDNMNDIFDSIHNDTNHHSGNILTAIDLFIQSLHDTSTTDISNMIIVIITNKNCHHNSIISKFDKNHMPHIIFWNMSISQSFYPFIENTEKITFISGYNALFLDHFRFIGFSGGIQFDSYNTVCNFINNPRYDSMGDYIEKIMVL